MGDREGSAVKSCTSLELSGAWVSQEGQKARIWSWAGTGVVVECAGHQGNESRCHTHPLAYWEDEWYARGCLCMHKWINAVALTQGAGTARS